MKVKDCMCKDVAYLAPQNTIKDCAKLMCDMHIGCVPVCDTNKNVVGLVTDRDLILRSIACDKNIQTTMLSDIMTCNVCSCNQEDDVEKAQMSMSNNQIRRLPVINNNNELVGIVTLGNLCKNQNVNTEDVSKTLEDICKTDNKNAE